MSAEQSLQPQSTVHSLCATNKQILRKKPSPHSFAAQCCTCVPTSLPVKHHTLSWKIRTVHGVKSLRNANGPSTWTIITWQNRNPPWLLAFPKRHKTFCQMPCMPQSVPGLQCFLLRNQVSKQFAFNLKHEHLDIPFGIAELEEKHAILLDSSKEFETNSEKRSLWEPIFGSRKLPALIRHRSLRWNDCLKNCIGAKTRTLSNDSHSYQTTHYIRHSDSHHSFSGFCLVFVAPKNG